MEVELFGWRSRFVDREQRVVRFGRRGIPVIYAPSSGGDEREFERYGLHDGVRPLVEDGRLQVFSIDGRGPDGFWNDSIPPAERVRRYAALERYVADELVGWIAMLLRPAVRAPWIAGCSYGGFLAANLLCKYPERVTGAVGLGGVYGLWHRLDGHHDDDVYFHTPLEYLPRLEDPEILGRIRETRGMALYAAHDDGWVESSRRLRDVFADRGIPHTYHEWHPPADHHERWWKAQLAHWLERAFPDR